MATQTTNLGLTKPDEAEGYDVNVFNANADAIDNAVGALQNELGGGTGEGLGDKVDALQESMTAARSEIAAVKTDTEALAKALETANQNIATLLTQTKGVRNITTGDVSLSATTATQITIPENINPDKIVFIISGRITANISYDSGIYWSRSGNVITVQANSSGIAKYQIIEFY